MLMVFMEMVSEAADAVPARASEAEPRSFEAFFAAQHARLQRALFVLTGNDQEAEDLMQESFIAVFERWDRVGSMENPTGYLYRTAMNRHRSRVRRARRMARRMLGAAGAEDAFAAIEERDALARALARIPARQRAAVVLTDMLGFDAASAARILRVTDATVRSLASQGRGALRRTLEDEHD